MFRSLAKSLSLPSLLLALVASFPSLLPANLTRADVVRERAIALPSPSADPFFTLEDYQGIPARAPETTVPKLARFVRGTSGIPPTPPPSSDIDLPFSGGAISGCTSIAQCVGNPGQTQTTWVPNLNGSLNKIAPFGLRLSDLGLLEEPGSDNLLFYASDVTQTGAWTTVNATTTANSATAPDGVSMASRFTETTANGIHGVQQSITKVGANQNYTLSGYVLPVNFRNFGLQLQSNSSNYTFVGIGATCNSSYDGAPQTSFTAFRWTVVSAGINGWCFFTFSANSDTATTFTAQITSIAGGSTSFSGDGSSGLHLWCIQVEQAPQATSCINNGASRTARPGDGYIMQGPLGALAAQSQGYINVNALGPIPALSTLPLTVRKGSSYLAASGTIASRAGTTDAFLKIAADTQVRSRIAGADQTSAIFGSSPGYSAGAPNQATGWGGAGIQTLGNGGSAVTIATTYAGSPSAFIGSNDGSTGHVNAFIGRLRAGLVQPSVATLQTLAPAQGLLSCNNYFLSSLGNNSNDGCSTATPWATYTKAQTVTTLQHGNTFNVDAANPPADGCLSIGPAMLINPSVSDPVVLKPYNGSIGTMFGACSGELGVVTFDSVSGITVQDMALGWRGTPTARGTVLFRQNSGTKQGGWTVQRTSMGGNQYWLTTKAPAGQGFNGGDLFTECNSSYNSVSDTGGCFGWSVLNNYIGGTTPTSPDDSGMAGFANTSDINGNIAGWTTRGNIAANIGGGPTGQVCANCAYPPMGESLHHQGAFDVLAEYNIVHDSGGNFRNCGGPAGMMIAAGGTATHPGLLRFNEAFLITQVPFSVGGVGTYTGGCDQVGYDLDNGAAYAKGLYLYSHDSMDSGYLLFTNNNGGPSIWDHNEFGYSISERDTRLLAPGFATFTKVPLTSNKHGSFYNMVQWTDYQGASNVFGNTGVNAPCWTNQGSNFNLGIYANTICNANKQSNNGAGAVYNPINVGQTLTINEILSHNIYMSLNGAPWSNRYGNVFYTSLAAFQAAVPTQEIGSVNQTPNFSGSPPSGTCTWTPSTASSWPPSGCPAAYAGFIAGSPALNGGVDISTFAGLGLVNGNRDYYANTIPGAGGCYNIGAYGVC